MRSLVPLTIPPATEDGHAVRRDQVGTVHDHDDDYAAAGHTHGEQSIRGTATIADVDTHVDVPHGLDAAPERGEVQVTPASSLGDASYWWLSDRTATVFRINVDTAPGSDALFDWLWTPADPAPVTYGGLALEHDSYGAMASTYANLASGTYGELEGTNADQTVTYADIGA